VRLTFRTGDTEEDIARAADALGAGGNHTGL
jgi:hypothetical protein